MTSLLKNLLGNGQKDRELTEEMRAILQEMQEERGRCEALIESTRASSDRLQELGEPIAKAGSDVDAVLARLGELEQRFAAMVELTTRLQALDERAEGMAQSQERSAAEIARAVEDADRIRAVFEELSQKVDVALDLKNRLEAFLEVEKPFQQLRGDAETVRGHVDGTGERMARLREQHDRLIEAHQLALSKIEALDRRRDDLSRDLQDKERRVASVEEGVRGLDGIQRTVDDLERRTGTLKAMGDSVAQKTAALEAQREAVERALAQADHLERAMRQVDAGVRHLQDNEKALRTLQDHVTTLRSLHETVLERSTEISHLQRQTDEQMRATRQELSLLTDEAKKSVERFDFESRGLESVSQRVADLRRELSDCENRSRGLSEMSQTVGELRSQTTTLTTQLQTLSEEVGQVDQEMAKLRAIRRDLDETGRMVQDVCSQAGRFEEARPAIEAGIRDLAELSGSHALVKDSLEQTRVAQDEITRVRESQSETRSWLAGVEQSVSDLRGQVGAMHELAPAIEGLQKQAKHVAESINAVELRREFVDDLHRKFTDLGSLAGRLDERDRQLHSRIEVAEQQLVALTARAEEAERLATNMGVVASNMSETERRAGEIGKSVAAIAARCESIEDLEERTRALRPELEQRHHALQEATENLERASELRKEAATSAQKLGELSKKLTAALKTADERVTQVDTLSTELEDRAARLQSVEKRLGAFEERLAKWDAVEDQVARSLEELSVRQSTVETLRSDFDRLFALAEKTVADVREITSAHQEVEQTRQLLLDVTSRQGELRDATNVLEDRKRQMAKAEERLARAEALLGDVQSSIEALQGQKTIVDQAVEKAGSLQFLLKQAEATIEGLRQEREMSSRLRTAVTAGERGDEVEEDVAEAKTA